ncbi:type II toxin-antitoxin system prevent-host-death family antitoxin [Microbacterium sp.]|uniref:type II toxin-antitoxin system Phd/YefM family antitoxin n=1 Tax=Microbacterium sp. TaxID=51671 RepID=UPI0028AC14FA|nr:type II toxin-antitoxin system prevent-host-death family antitoxin [Microbacterium sp.]
MVNISASVARQTLPAQLDRVEAGEEVSISRHGKVVAVLVSPERLRSRRAQGAWQQTDALRERLARARSEPPEARIDAARADELAQAIDEGRAAR